MPLNPDAPFPKSRGDVLRSKDWNDMVNEVRRLDTDKMNLSGADMTGPLRVSDFIAIRTAAPIGGALLEVNSGAANASPIMGLSTPNGDDFLGFSGGRGNNQNPHIAWRRGNLRIGTATTFGGQAFSEKLRITESGNVGIGIDPAEKLHVNGPIRGHVGGGALRISSDHGFMDVGSQHTDYAHLTTDRPVFYFNKGIKVDTGLIGSQNENLQIRTGDDTRITILNANGNVGIGNTNPQDALDITGALRFEGNASRRISGELRTSRNTLVLSANWDELEIKGRVIDWTGSNLHIGYENDHAAHYIEMGRNVGYLRFLAGGGGAERLRVADTAVTAYVNLFGAARGTGNQRYRIASGRTTPGSTSWVQYGTNGVYVDVDTSGAGFANAPFYITSLGGNSGHWTTQGGTSVYSPTRNGFRIYVNQAGITTALANSRRWHINWIGVGT